jgi:hypothetical protein
MVFPGNLAGVSNAEPQGPVHTRIAQCNHLQPIPAPITLFGSCCLSYKSSKLEIASLHPGRAGLTPDPFREEELNVEY